MVRGPITTFNDIPIEIIDIIIKLDQSGWVCVHLPLTCRRIYELFEKNCLSYEELWVKCSCNLLARRLWQKQDLIQINSSILNEKSIINSLSMGLLITIDNIYSNGDIRRQYLVKINNKYGEIYEALLSDDEYEYEKDEKDENLINIIDGIDDILLDFIELFESEFLTGKHHIYDESNCPFKNYTKSNNYKKLYKLNL
jgi:hypothetical protein